MDLSSAMYANNCKTMHSNRQQLVVVSLWRRFVTKEHRSLHVSGKIEESARTLVALDVDGQQGRFNVEKTSPIQHTYNTWYPLLFTMLHQVLLLCSVVYILPGTYSSINVYYMYLQQYSSSPLLPSTRVYCCVC